MAVTSIVIPSVGRPSLRVLLQALAQGTVPVTCPVVVVDDRRDGEALALADIDLPGLCVVRSGGGGPARARNIGWRNTSTEWVSFLDDDVVPDADWYAELLGDLESAGTTAAGSQGRVRVPLPPDRRPTDWERTTAGLATATWITADLSYRRAALAAVGGFDERFPRAFREDADLGLRITGREGEITRGERWISHPVRPADDWISVRQQAGNADDFLMRRIHGADWRKRAHAPRGRRGRHAAVVASACVAMLGAAAGRRRVAGLGAAAWLAGTAELALARIAPGPRDADEVRRMLRTSVVIPFAATWHSVRGAWQHRHAGPWQGLPELVLLDRDGTLVHDVPYNGDPALVRPVAGARRALDRLRAEGIRLGVISNQSGVARGHITSEQVQAVNDRVEELLGPFDTWRICPHGPDEGCTCRKPAPGMVKDSCAELDVAPGRCLVIGDIGSDMEAASAAGARAILVPTPATLPDEVAAATHVAAALEAAVDDVLGGRW